MYKIFLNILITRNLKTTPSIHNLVVQSNIRQQKTNKRVTYAKILFYKSIYTIICKIIVFTLNSHVKRYT